MIKNFEKIMEKRRGSKVHYFIRKTKYFILLVLFIILISVSASGQKINPDGYNIILQGDINKLIEMTPNHRREIIEEIAGISIYEEKKQKAIRELDRVENKLNEAEIILSERETYLKGLKKERDQAQKFKEIIIIQKI